MGGRLPQHLSEWVLHDTTCRSWALRQVVRSLLAVLPLVLILLFAVPGPLWIRALSALGGVVMSLLYSLGFVSETAEHRLVKAGYPAGTGAAVRQQRSSRGRGRRPPSGAGRRCSAGWTSGWTAGAEPLPVSLTVPLPVLVGVAGAPSVRPAASRR